MLKAENGSNYPWLFILLAIIIILSISTAQEGQAVQEGHDIAAADHLIDSLISQMTLEEKLGQLTQFRWPWGESVERERERQEYLLAIREGSVGSFLGIHGVDNTRKLQRIAVEESRLRIPLLFAHDVIHGFRTVMPVPLAEASSWDPEAVERSARIAAVEATAAGLHWTFAPMVDIARDPRWGRIVEGSGEDPYLGAVMAAARVHGFQGKNLSAANTLLACAKHFAAYGGAEAGRDYNPVDISPRTLLEIYLPPFHAAVDAGVGSLMGAFNEIGGIPMHSHSYLINEVLRGEWGFDGVFISDYTAIEELQKHGVALNRVEAGKIALNAGVDIDMVSGIYKNDLPQLVREGKISQELVDKAVRRVLEAKFKLGLFDDPFHYHDLNREKNLTLTQDHIAAARDMARKSIVLLKNENGLLPLTKKIETLAVIGALANDQDAPLGSWRAAGKPEDAVSVLAGIRNSVSPQTNVLYEPGYDLETFADTVNFNEAIKAAKMADVVVLVLGERARVSGEASNRSDIGLPGRQQALAQAIHAVGKPVVVLLMNGRPLAIPWLAEHIPAIVETWFLGVQMGHAVADVLFGDYNPGGKLPVTFPRAVGQIPIYYNHKNTGRPPSEESYYTSKYLDIHWTPLYSFGYGLSYTQFSYKAPGLSSASLAWGDTLDVEVTVKNSGSRAGDEVVQLYIQDEAASVTRPVKQLRGLRRIYLHPGETQTISFKLTLEDLKFYDLNMNYTAEPGFFTVYVGGNSVDVQEARFELLKKQE